MGMKSILKKIASNVRREVKTPVYIPVSYGNILIGKTVLITGGYGGIGYAIAKVCIRNGASVILAGRDEKKLKVTIDEIGKERRLDTQQIIPLTIDVQNVDAIKAKIEDISCVTPQKRIDILINNAGVSAGCPIGKTAEEDYDKVLDTNMKGTYFMAQEFANYLIEHRINGNILNISSVSGIRPAITPYMLSKWGIIGLTEGLAKKLIKYGIVVNGIAPGPTATDMLNKDGSDLMYNRSPAQRYADPMEIANLAVFLISDMGRMIVGDTVYITGGCGNLTVDDITY